MVASGVMPFLSGPILGASSFSTPPSFLIARCRAAIALASLPSVTMAASTRPLMVRGALPTIDNAGEGGRSLHGRTAGVILSAWPAMPIAAATRLPSSGSMMSRWPSMRLRTAIVATLLSSNVKAPTMWLRRFSKALSAAIF